MLDRSAENNISVEDSKDCCVLRVGERILKRSLGTAICARIAGHKGKSRFTDVSIDLLDRNLDHGEVEKLKKYVQDHCKVAVRHIYSNTADISRKSTCEMQNIAAEGWSESNNTLYMRSTVRCGQTLSYDGSIVLAGGLNAGGLIEAAQSVVVLGELCGEARAGLSGGANPFIYAGSFKPVKVSISGVSLTYSRIPERMVGANVICSRHQNELILKERFGETHAKGCVSVGY
jgi:septum site-determining protein MinC